MYPFHGRVVSAFATSTRSWVQPSNGRAGAISYIEMVMTVVKVHQGVCVMGFDSPTPNKFKGRFYLPNIIFMTVTTQTLECGQKFYISKFKNHRSWGFTRMSAINNMLFKILQIYGGNP